MQHKSKLLATSLLALLAACGGEHRVYERKSKLVTICTKENRAVKFRARAAWFDDALPCNDRKWGIDFRVENVSNDLLEPYVIESREFLDEQYGTPAFNDLQITYYKPTFGLGFGRCTYKENGWFNTCTEEQVECARDILGKSYDAMDP